MIKFVYFDVGGVAIQDFSSSNKWEEMQLDMGIDKDQHDEFEKVWDEIVEPRVNLDYDVDEFISQMQQRFELDFPSNYSLLDEFIKRFEPNRTIGKIVEDLTQQYIGLGLLTNMYPRMLQAIQATNLLPPANWDAIIDSSIEMTQKPEFKIYQISQDRAGVPAEQILFIDNTKGHLEPAKKLGWQIFHYDSSDYDRSSQLLEKYIKENV